MGAGDDTFVWNPGDDNDTLEGQAGFDTMLFNGAKLAENIDIVGQRRARAVLRDIATVAMDLNDVERSTSALGGADNITVDDLSGTDVARVARRPRRDDGGGRRRATRNSHHHQRHQRRRCHQRRERQRRGSPSPASGQRHLLHHLNFDVNDRLVINGLGGDDVIAASGAEPAWRWLAGTAATATTC